MGTGKIFTIGPSSTQLLAVIPIKRPILDQLTNFPLYRSTNTQIFGWGWLATTAMTTTDAEERSTDSSGATEEGTASPIACRDIRCDFGASCGLGSDGYPRCSCLFECPPDDEYFPVCASDFRLYPSLCAMRKEGCQKQLELRLRPLDLCKGLSRRIYFIAHLCSKNYLCSRSL